jgi:hypothetical protein
LAANRVTVVDTTGTHLDHPRYRSVARGQANGRWLAQDEPRLLRPNMTMDGLRREGMIDGLGEPAGATAMLMEAQDAITLFI